jgi:hypothetical protein
MLDLEHVCAYFARGRWFRHISSQGQFSLGAQRYTAGKDVIEQQLEITFAPQTRELICRFEHEREEL